MEYNFVLIIIAILLIAGLVVSYFSLKLKREEYKATGKYPRGHYMGQGLAIGIVIGIPLAFLLDNIFMGYMIGLVIGTVLGTRWENKHEDELRPLSAKERDLRKKMIIAFGILLALVIVAFAAVNF